MTTETHENPRNGAITGGLTTGIIGTSLGALSLLGNGNGLGGILGGGCKSNYVTKEEFEMGQKLAAKDSTIAMLESEKADEKKMVEVYTALNTQINAVKDIIAANKDRADDRLACSVEKLTNKIDFNKSVQDGVNATQLAYNGSNSATLACMQNQLAQLYGITKMVVPNSNVCPGWGNITITPALSTTA
jgi:hypothetical protein